MIQVQQNCKGQFHKRRNVGGVIFQDLNLTSDYIKLTIDIKDRHCTMAGCGSKFISGAVARPCLNAFVSWLICPALPFEVFKECLLR